MNCKKGERRRTFGGITGLNDLPLLPDLFAQTEDRWTIESVLLVWMFLLRKQGLRPVDMDFDDLDSSFLIAVSCMEASFPSLVLRASLGSPEALSHLAGGRVVVDIGRRCAQGCELGQDALHVY